VKGERRVGGRVDDAIGRAAGSCGQRNVRELMVSEFVP